MQNDKDVRSRIESNTEIIAAIGALALPILLYHLLRNLLHFPEGLSQVAALAAVPIVLWAVRVILVRDNTANREIREAMAGSPAINPFFVCVAMAASIQFVAQFSGALCGVISVIAVGGASVIFGVPFEESDLAAVFQFIVPELSIFILAITFLSTWPITQAASHYFRKWPILWIVVALILSQMLGLGIAGITLAIPGNILGDMDLLEELSWSTILGQLVVPMILIPPALIGYYFARRGQSAFLLMRTFRKLHRNDQEAVLDLLIERHGVVSDKQSRPPRFRWRIRPLRGRSRTRSQEASRRDS